MRIGIDIKTFKNRAVGIPVYLRNLLDMLQAIDSVNDYVLYEQKPSDYRIVNPRWKKLLIPSHLPGTAWLQLRVAPRLRRDGIDLFWGPEQMCPLFKPPSIIYCTTIHDFTFRHFPETVQWSTRIILGLTWRRVFAVSDLLLPVSDRIREETVHYLQKLRLTGNAVETVTNGGPGWTVPPEYHAEDRDDTLLFIGTIEPRKNLVGLIEALELLQTRGECPSLAIVGSGSWKSGPFTKKLAGSPVRDRINLCGFLSPEALRRQLLSCKALVFPSIYEGFGIPVLEALSLDCLVLTSKGTVMEQVAGECACYFDPRDPQDIADCIERIYRPGFNREQYLARRGEVLTRFTWNNSARTLIAQFGRLFESKKTSPDKQ